MNENDYRDYMNGRHGGGSGIWGLIGQSERNNAEQARLKKLNGGREWWELPERQRRASKTKTAKAAGSDSNRIGAGDKLIESWERWLQSLPKWVYPVFFGLPCMGWGFYMAFMEHGMSWWLLAGAVLGYFLPLLVTTILVGLLAKLLNA